MKTAYVITAREKAKLAPHVERCVLAAFAQKTREPIDIILSDQGSTDGTRELLQRLGQYTDNCASNVLRLDWRRYEYLPANGTDHCPGAAIVHYRGPRKAWFDAWAGATS